MSQNSLILPTTGVVSGLQMTQDMNNALDTLNTLASGASSPSSPEAGQLWHDTTNNLLKIRSLDNTSWIPFLQLNESAYLALPNFPSQITGDLNRLVNPDMVIDQVNEGASYSVPNTNTPTYSVDQWIVSCLCSGASGVTAQRVTDAPNGFTNSLKVTVGTGAGSVGVTDFLYLYQPIEGLLINDLNYGSVVAQPTSLSFWVKSSIAGTFAAVLQNGAGSNRSLVNKFTVATPGVWQLVTLPNIPGDQSGTWPTTSSQSLNLLICIATGTTDQTSTLNAWQTGNFLGSNTQTNTVLTTNGATFQVSGFTFNPGVFCLPHAKRFHNVEQALCERYYEKTFPQGTAVAQNAGTSGGLFVLSNSATAATLWFNWLYRVRKRVGATLTTYNPSAADANWRDITASTSPTAGALFGSDAGAGFFSSSSIPVGDNVRIHATSNARM